MFLPFFFKAAPGGRGAVAMTVPTCMLEIRDRIAVDIGSFCREKMGCGDGVREDFVALCVALCEKLCRKRPSPLERGRRSTWISGIIHAVGTVNFMFDPGEDIYVKPRQLADYFDVAPSSVTTRSKVIRDLFGMTVAKPDWILPGRFGPVQPAAAAGKISRRRGRPFQKHHQCDPEGPPVGCASAADTLAEDGE
jgi:hypothetical protein